MPEFVRASSLLNFGELVQELGGDPAELLAAGGLRPELLGASDSFIPLRRVSDLLERAAFELGCPDLGLRLSARQSIDILGPIALIARHSATAREAMHGIGLYLPGYSSALKVSLEDLGAGVSRFHFRVEAAIAYSPQLVELGVGVCLGIFGLLIGSGFRPTEVAFEHAPVADPAAYRSFFGCPARFDAEYSGIGLNAADLERSRPHSSPDVRVVAAGFLESTAPLVDDDLSARVRDLLVRMLPTGQASWGKVASHLGISGRTLQRWLAAEGTTFEALLDDVRRERARHYLTNSRLSLGQIATILGYSHQSCLSRSSVRWFGMTPRQVRTR